MIAFRDFSFIFGLQSLSVVLLAGVLVLELFLSSFVLYVILKLLQREDVLGAFQRSGGTCGFFRVFDTRVVLWTFYGFVSALDVSLADLAWMYAIVILVALLAYEFLFDLGALKTSIAFVFDFALTLVSAGLLYLVFLFVTGALTFPQFI